MDAETKKEIKKQILITCIASLTAVISFFGKEIYNWSIHEDANLYIGKIAAIKKYSMPAVDKNVYQFFDNPILKNFQFSKRLDSIGRMIISEKEFLSEEEVLYACAGLQSIMNSCEYEANRSRNAIEGLSKYRKSGTLVNNLPFDMICAKKLEKVSDQVICDTLKSYCKDNEDCIITLKILSTALFNCRKVPNYLWFRIALTAKGPLSIEIDPKVLVSWHGKKYDFLIDDEKVEQGMKPFLINKEETLVINLRPISYDYNLPDTTWDGIYYKITSTNFSIELNPKLSLK